MSITYRKGYKYQLVEKAAIKVGLLGYGFIHDFFALEDGILYIKAGYSWDGPSGPAFDTPSFMRGSLAHDVLYQAIREGQLPLHRRKYADQALVDICKADGMPWYRRKWVYWAVQRYGEDSAIHARKTITAP